MGESKRFSQDLGFTVISILVYIFDVYSDYLLGVTYIIRAGRTKREYVFGFLTLFFAIFPAILNAVKVLSNRKKLVILRKYCPTWFGVIMCIFLQARLVLLLTVGKYQIVNIINRETIKRTNYESTLEQDLQKESVLIKVEDDSDSIHKDEQKSKIPKDEILLNDFKADVALTETFIGALPQFIIQMYIVTQVKRVITLLQFISMIGSICGATFSYSSRFQSTSCTKGVIFFLTFLMLFTRINTLVLSASLWKWMPLLIVLIHLFTVAMLMRCFYHCCCGICGGDDKRGYNSFVFILRRWHNVWLPSSTGCTLLFAIHMAIENAIIIFLAAFFFPAENIPEQYTESPLFYNKVILHLNGINPALFIMYTWLLLGLLQLLYLILLVVGKIFRSKFYELMDSDDFHIGRFTC